LLFVLAFIRAAHACVRENVPLHSFKGVSSPCWCMFCSFLFCLLCSVSAGFRLVLGSLFPCTLQGRLFPLLVHVMFCWFPACIASLSCSFLIYTFLTFDQKKKEQREGACSPALASCVLLRSRESVPFAGVCTVLLVSSLYRKLVLLFLIYILLTFDKKKRKSKEKVRFSRERSSRL